MLDDAAHYSLLVPSGAHLSVRLAPGPSDRPELQLHGNRRGLLALANIVLWLHANSDRRESLSFAELSFVESALGEPLSLHLRDGDATGVYGLLRETPDGAVEWTLAEADLQRLGLLVHRLVSLPKHEYDRPPLEAGGNVDLHIRMLDIGHWL